MVVITAEWERIPLTRWGLAIARSMKKPLCLVYVSAGSPGGNGDAEPTPFIVGESSLEKLDPIWEPVLAEIGELGPSEGENEQEKDQVELIRISGSKLVGKSIEEAKSRSAGLIIAAKHELASGSEELTLPNRLMIQAPCAVMLFRPGGSGPSSVKRILVPTSEGPHAVSALRYAHQLAEMCDAELVPFFCGA